MNNGDQIGYASKNGSDPAQPVQGFRESEDSLKLYGQLFHGLTKREHFAAMAMQGALSNQRMQMDKPAKGIAICAVNHADALLKALENN